MNWKKLWFGILVIGIPLTMLAASIRWYNDAGIPQKTAPDGSEIISLQQTGPNAYRWAYLRDVLPAGTTVNITSNYTVFGPNYYTNQTIVNEYWTTNVLLDQSVSNYFYTYAPSFNYYTNLSITNYISQDTYVSNVVIQQITTNTTLNTYYSTNITLVVTNNYTNTIGGEFIANQGGFGTNTTFRGTTKFDSLNEYSLPMIGESKYLLSIANSYGILTNNGNGIMQWTPMAAAINVISNTTITTKQLTVYSNITYLSATPFTNAWANGPTGTLDLAVSDQNYSAAGDMDLTGVINKSNNVVQNVLLTILATGANRTIYLTGAFAESTGATSYVCTNGVPREIWVRYTPALGGLTNVCSLPFYRP